MLEIVVPPKLSLALLPTRVTPLRRISDELDGPLISMKRDDETGCALSGNKVRKLEYLLAEAAAEGATVVVTCGAVQSNHARATAVAARQLGMKAHLVLRGQEPAEAEGNYLLDLLVGATFRFIGQEDWARREEIMAEEAQRLEAEGEHPYVIPEGGSNALGAWGYISMMAELVDENGRIPYTHLLCPLGSAGTLAGLLLGRAILEAHVEILAVNVCDDAETFRRRVEAIVAEFNRRHGTDLVVSPDEYEILEGYEGPGYGIPFDEEIAWIRRLAATEAVFLDPVYTGKAFVGLVDQIRKGRFRSSDHVLFIHTGGIFGLFPHRTRLAGPSRA
jgi:D-cysteine desulfhydrase